MKRITIPKDVNKLPLLDAVSLYQNNYDWIIHPLKGSSGGGKQPLIKDWRNLDNAFLTPQLKSDYFGNSAPCNIGCVAKPQQIIIDLDSKADNGESVSAWLGSQIGLLKIPREKTGGGAHIHLMCDDLPVFRKTNGKPYKKALVSTINKKVTAELFYTGLNIVLSPSHHKNGFVYRWETFGDIPLVTWLDIKEWFGFEEPEGTESQKTYSSPRVELPYWGKYKGDLRSLDLVTVFRQLKLGCEITDADEDKFAVECPWRGDHSDTEQAWTASDTSAVIWCAKNNYPTFKCLHAHCEERSLEQLLAYAELRGVKIDDHCSEMRVWIAGRPSGDGTPRVVLPSLGKTDSEFANEIGDLMSTKNCWFNFDGIAVVLRESQIGDDHTCLSFHPIKTVEAGTNLEQHIQTGCLRKDQLGDQVFHPHSLKREAAGYLLAANQFLERLPKIVRILDTPIPVLTDGQIIYPEPGYSPKLQCYVNPNSPKLVAIDWDEGLGLINELLTDFCFINEQARINTVAKLLSPFCRGLMGWDAKMPLWLFEANRERSGKDYLCELIQIIHEGRSSSHPVFESDAELRKKITSALVAGVRRMHFGNMRGHINSKVLEHAITAKIWDDRFLGRNENCSLRNEIEFSLSTNLNTTWTPDLDQRMISIELFLALENPNDRRFSHPSLHQWAKERRSKILSTLVAFVRKWDAAGQPSGSAPFASFPEWASVVGGIMEVCGLGTPRQSSVHRKISGGDENTDDMKTLFLVAVEQFGSDWLTKNQLYNLATEQELFSWWDFTEHKGKTAFGKALNRFVGRQLGGIKMDCRGGKNTRQYQFTLIDVPTESSEGTSGTSETVQHGVSPSFNTVRSNFEGTSGTLGPYITPEDSLTDNTPPTTMGVGIEQEHTSNGVKQVPNVPDVPSPQHRVLTNPSLLGEVATIIRQSAASVALDIETYGNGLNPWRGDIRLLSLAIPGHPAWLLDLQSIGYDLGELGQCLQERQIIAHNAKFDLLWLRHKCALKLDNVFCTLTAARLLSNGKRELRNGLYACWERFLGLAPGNDHGKSDWGGMFLTEDQLEYAALDVFHLHELQEKQQLLINKEKLGDVLHLENRLIPVVVEMENRGFGINKERLLGVIEEYSAELDEALGHFKEAFGEEINPNSPKQLKEAFKEKDLKLSDTGEQTLKEEDHPLTTCVLNYRSAKKQMEQAEALLKAIEEDGRIHARFEPTGTNTGRFSSKRPNLQNIGRGKLRHCFVPDEGNLLVVADYSQVELRVAAVVANEERMIEAYKNGVDLHRQTASLVLDKPIEEVTKEDRQLAKAVNFGLLYGQSAKGLVAYAKKAYGVEMEYDRAREIHGRFFSAYNGLRKWHERSREAASKDLKSVRTVSGRVRWLPEGKDTEWIRFVGLLNTSVQGGSADALKQAMVNLADKLPSSASIVSTVHDELIVECASDAAEEIKALVETAMLDAVQTMFPGVRFEVEAGICDSWAEK